MNLLAETVKYLAQHGKSSSDVRWVQTAPHAWTGNDPLFSFSWDEFVALANFEYDDGYGGAEINTSLRIVGDDWWIERGEYDGSEWWEFKTLPTKPPTGIARASDLREP